MEKVFTKVFFVLMFTLFAHSALAVPAYPYPVKFKQPDGATLSVILKGDEFHKYYTTEDGVLITKSEQGLFNYARLESGNKVVDTGIKAKDLSLRSAGERSFVANLPKNPDMSLSAGRMRAKKAVVATTPLQRYPKEGSPRSLVILVNFSDLEFVVPNPKQSFTDLLNKKDYSANGATGSARDYFRDNSSGAFTPQFDVVGPYTLPNTLKFYGENTDDGDDINPAQMVVDACQLAHNDSVDFSVYDTDSDGIVDNVFIYYAGYNEAEWADENTVWPHRWGVYPNSMFGGSGNYSGTVQSTIFNGKRVEDYACTSELKSNSGADMCGIGTFVHEFGHVLGLADMYPTNGSEHFTLSDWNVMDGGAYLNEGRTPPAYNAFERFQLGYLNPKILSENSTTITLEPLVSKNEAYLVSKSGTHNLDGDNPSPTEFFLLENRQKTNWDAFLPGHGMLIYRINYDKNDWYYNEPNNNANKMGVQLMPADGVESESTLSGDPFPGTSNITAFDFVFRSNEKLEKGIRNISETNEVISFIYSTPLGVPAVPQSSDSITTTKSGFLAKWNAVPDATAYTLNVYTKTEGGEEETVFTENFDQFSAGQPNSGAHSTDVSNTLDSYTQTAGWKGAKVFQAGGSVKIGSSSSLGYITTPALDLSADGGGFTLKFDATAWIGDEKSLKIFINDGLQLMVDNMDNTKNSFTSYEIQFSGGGTSSTEIKFEGSKASKARFFLNNLKIIQKSGGKKVPVPNSPFTTTELNFQVENLDPTKTYYYTVSAVNGEQTSAPSKEVGPISFITTNLERVDGSQLVFWKKGNEIFFNASKGEIIEIYNLNGQKIQSNVAVHGVNGTRINSAGVFILKVGQKIRKIVL